MSRFDRFLWALQALCLGFWLVLAATGHPFGLGNVIPACLSAFCVGLYLERWSAQFG